LSDFRLKMTFGFLLLFLLAVLAGIIAVGKVEQETSFGLQYILGGLTALAGGFAHWAFGADHDKEKPNGSS